MRKATSQEFAIDLAYSWFVHRRVKDLVIALGSPTDLGRRLSALAARRRRTRWAFADLYDPETPLPADFRFAVAASSSRYASFVWLHASTGLLDDLFTQHVSVDHLDAVERLPAVCFRAGDVRGGLVLFADDGSLPPYPDWHAIWPATVPGTRVVSIRLAKWSRWVRWAAAVAPHGLTLADPPQWLALRNRVLFAFLASALEPAPTAAQQRLLLRAEGRRWVVASNADLAAAVGLTGRQVQAATKSLVSAGLAERLARQGDGTAWGVRVLAPVENDPFA